MQTSFTTTTHTATHAGSGYPAGGLISGDITSPARLVEVAQQADALAEQVQALMRLVREAAVTLPDRLTAGGWGTQDITQTAQDIATVAATEVLSPADVDALTELLRRMTAAVEDAEQLGAQVETQDAQGQAEAFTDA